MRAIAAGVVLGILVGTALAQAPSPSPPQDRSMARTLYHAAEDAMKAGRYAEAIRDYEASYDLTRDPILFFKIGAANERAGKCDVALIYYGRYLREAQTTETFVTLTRERIRACGGDDRNMLPRTPAGSATPPAAGSGSATPPAPAAGSAAGSAAPADAEDPPAAQPVPAAATPAPGTKVLPARNRGAWLLVGSTVALVTIGSVLAYSASSAENDITDLYVGLGNQPPSFDPRLQETYDDLVAEGERFQHLSWISYGLALATAVGATVMFATAPERVQLAPTASATGAGVTLGGRF